MLPSCILFPPTSRWSSLRTEQHRFLFVLPQVLYNKEELPLTELCGTPACDLQLFK